MAEKKLVGIIMGSDSDLPVMKEAADILEEFGVGYEIRVLSAHRTPNQTSEYAAAAHQKGLKVIIAGAGGAAHLAGVIAAFSPLPVIAVPIKSKSLDGLDSLLSMVQMPPGVPVGVVGINQAKNAGLLAVQVLGTSDLQIQEKMLSYKKKMEEDVIKKDQNLKSKLK
ncbi:MAG: 5-(carboxyamino)imidazole ribonucleotide mutase [Ignavibacteria bacterium]